MNSGFDTLLEVGGAFLLLAAVIYLGLSVLDVQLHALSSQARALGLVAVLAIAVYLGVN